MPSGMVRRWAIGGIAKAALSEPGWEKLLISIILCIFAQIIEGDSPAFLIGIKGSPSGIG